MKICLATLHANPDFTPLALLYLKASVVDRLGHLADDVAIVEGAAADADVEALAAHILSTSPRIVGLSCYVWNVQILLAAARRIKALAPEIAIVLGGPEVGPIAADVLRAHPAVDVIVKSEGEVPFAELVARWRDGGAIDDVRGVCCRGDGQIVEHEDATVVTDLGELLDRPTCPASSTRKGAWRASKPSAAACFAATSASTTRICRSATDDSISIA